MDPLTIALLGGAASIGGSLFTNQAQEQVQAARNAAINTDLTQQAALDAQAKTVTDGSLSRLDNFGTQQAADATRLGALYNTAPTTISPNTSAALPVSTNPVVNREIANKSAIATAYGQQQGTARGALDSFGDLMGGINRSQAADDQAVGEIGGFKQGDTNVEKIALNNANLAGDTDASIGNILSGAGKVGLTAGLSGSLKGGAPTGALNSNGSIFGAAGPTSVGGLPLIGSA
jgi:hypothetical protein